MNAWLRSQIVFGSSFALAVSVASVASATTITLHFSSLPTAQGWTFISDGEPEGSVFSLSEGVLTQNTLAGPFSTEGYNLYDVIDPALPYSMEVRARVLQESGSSATNSFGFCFDARLDDQVFGIGIGTSRIEDILANVISTSIDNTQFHDYRLEVTPNVGYEFFVDGALIASGPPRYGTFRNTILFGDCTRGAGAHAEIVALRFRQLLEVAIDIKPGSDPNCFNLNGHGVIPVAVLGSTEFDVADIDHASLRLDGLAVRIRGNRGPLCAVENVNGDSFPDLVCHFDDDPWNWTGGQDTATLSGSLLNGASFEGTDSICVVP